jgi:thiamine biosynthesis lipoprotein
MINFQFEAIGTKWVIDIYKKLSSPEEVFLLEKIKNRIDVFDKTYSRFKDDSLIIKMSKKTGEYILPEDSDKMISLYKKIYDISLGLVTPLIGQTLVDMGYDQNYSLKTKEQLYKPVLWDDVLEWNNPKLNIKKTAILDFGAGGKGYLVDIIGELLEVNGIEDYTVDAGGDIRHRNKTGQGIAVGLENSHDTTEVLGVVKVLNQSICASASNRRTWGNLHHIVNPETLKPAREVLSVWVTTDSTLLSDILATALFFVTPEKLLKYFNFEYLIMHENNSITKSGGFTAELFTE